MEIVGFFRGKLIRVTDVARFVGYVLFFLFFFFLLPTTSNSLTLSRPVLFVSVTLVLSCRTRQMATVRVAEAFHLPARLISYYTCNV